MSQSDDMHLAGRFTIADWQERRPPAGALADTWDELFRDFFVQRLKSRYLAPIDLLLHKGGYQGVGFSVMTILCSLVEFLESTAQGINYHWTRNTKELGEFEYGHSGKIFTSFLSTRSPFSEVFNAEVAHDFYTNVRCALLHEASTKNGWRIWAGRGDGCIANVAERIIYRNNFRHAIDEYIQGYGCELVESHDLQAAFIRKFDHLARMSAAMGSRQPHATS